MCWSECPGGTLTFWACCGVAWVGGCGGGRRRHSYKWKTNNRFFRLLYPALFCRLAGWLASGLCWCVAQQQSKVIISLAVSIRFNFSSRLHLAESLDCVTLCRWNQCRAAKSLYFSKKSQAPPKGKRSMHMCLEMHTYTHTLLLYVYISVLSEHSSSKASLCSV